MTEINRVAATPAQLAAETAARQAADALLIPLAQRAAANGVATLGADSKLTAGQLPALAITDTFVAASQVAMLALAAHTGDVCVRTDLSESFILAGSDPTVLSNWVHLLSPPDAVTSVAGKVGTVVLVEGDVTGLVADLAARVVVGGDIGGTPSAPTVVGLHLAGDTAVGHKLTSVTDPTGAQDAATKNYVDSVAAGINPAVAVQAATTLASDTSGLASVAGTLVGALNTALTVDGYTFTALGQRLLVKDDTVAPAGARNGVYYVTQLQALGLPVVLTRALDYDVPADINNTGAIPVVNGNLNRQTSWLLTSQVTVVGTDPLTYVQFTYRPQPPLGALDVQVFRAGSGQTWYKPAGAKYVHAFIAGPGGGAGGGVVGATSRSGGGGGGGGGTTACWFEAADLAASVAVSVGAGGAGGAGVSAGAGNAGAAGSGASTFGTLLTCNAGNGGSAGGAADSTGGTGGTATRNIPVTTGNTAISSSGTTGGACVAATGVAANGTNGGSAAGNIAAGGGGAGGGVSAGGAGNNGGSGGTNSPPQTNRAGATGVGTNFPGGTVVGLYLSSFAPGGGGGGGGNTLADASVGTHGGLGGLPGGGGAGGASATAGTAGSGGAGGDGICVVVCW